jgi:hypothetical protein
MAVAGMPIMTAAINAAPCIRGFFMSCRKPYRQRLSGQTKTIRRQHFRFALAYKELSLTVTMAPVMLVLFQAEVPSCGLTGCVGA